MAAGYGRGHRQRTPCTKALMHRQSNGVIAHHSPPPPITLKNGPRVLTHNLPCPPGPRADELVTGFIFLSGATHREAEATPLKESAILPGAQMKKKIARVTWYYLFARQSRECTSLTGAPGSRCISTMRTDALCRMQQLGLVPQSPRGAETTCRYNMRARATARPGSAAASVVYYCLPKITGS